MPKARWKEVRVSCLTCRGTAPNWIHAARLAEGSDHESAAEWHVPVGREHGVLGHECPVCLPRPGEAHVREGIGVGPGRGVLVVELPWQAVPFLVYTITTTTASSLVGVEVLAVVETSGSSNGCVVVGGW